MSLKFHRSAAQEHYFASDYHWGHKNVLKYDKRPFETIEEHDLEIVRNHNSIVRPNDHFWFVGDLSLGDIESAEEMLKSMNGIKHFIKGNHDHEETIELYNRCGFYHGEQITIVIDGQKIILNHCRMYVWPNSHHGSWNVHGHSHGTLDNAPWGKSIDVGINIRDYCPISFSELSSYMSLRDMLITDHRRTA
jgi:calcineurin-like phosphoesterase family protein